MSDKRRRQTRRGQEAGAAEQLSEPQQTSESPAQTCRRPSRAGSQQGEQDLSGTEASESTGDCPAAETPQLLAGAEGNGQKADGETTQGQPGDDEDSDDSDVSGTYEDDELDDEDDDEVDEEELSDDLGNSGDHRCSVCDLQLPSKFKLQDHMNLHTGARPYCCAECGKRFCQIYSYRVHLRTHAKAKAERLWCRICLMGFGSQEELKKHLSRAHPEDRFYECDLCKRVFTSLKDCQSHVQFHKCMVNIACEVCGRSFRSEKSLARHKKRTCLRSFKCTDCHETFAKKNALLKHSFSHLGLLPYTCIRCRCHFRLAKLYRKHKCEPQRIHCVACLREFLSQDEFQQHKRDTGCWGNQEPNQKTGEIRCLECGQRFDAPEELKKHAGAHQRVLKCAECGKGFRSALLLMSHMGGHAGQSPCFCQSCGLGFPYQQNYDSHLKTCGQTPQPVSVPKKHPTPKSSPPKKAKKKKAKPSSANTANSVPVPDPVPTSPATPLSDSCSPAPGSGSLSAASSDGLWTLTIDEKPPPGVNLVLFVPVGPTSEMQTLPVAAVRAVPQTPPSALSSCSELLGANAAVGVPLNASLELLTGYAGSVEAPLDLSKKCSSPAESNAPLRVKREPKEFGISKQEHGAETRGTDGYSAAKRCKTEPRVLSPLSAQTASPELTVHIKGAPPSPGSGLDLWSSTCSQLTRCGPEKKIKMETDL
ncbi:zinc finger protein 668 [Kryptolebias marmoratus]|uniref:zinc finger protein 668 n=1 Tax=Kryptolebias marmoratus TaxID=37003 RepID=UPI0007F90C38|nr:zinc finger protein 668 [Kryptolebias marmoratus]